MKSILLLLIAMITVACSSKTENTADSAEDDYSQPENSVTTDLELQTQATSLVIADALESLADTNEGDVSAAGLALADNSTTKSKTCEVKDDEAIVTIERTIDRTQTIERRRLESTRRLEGSSSTVRSFTSDEALSCDDNRVDIDWLSDISGLKLSSTVDRSLTMSSTTTFKPSGRERELLSERTLEATRDIEWTKHTVEGENFLRTKSLSFSSKRSHSVQNSKGDERTLSFDMNTEDPLVIEVERVATTGMLVTKTIQSGSIVSERKDDGSLTTTFKDFKVSFEDDECTIQSGQVDFVIKDDDSEVAKFQLLVEDGTHTLKNLTSGETISEYEIDECSIEDFASDLN